MGIPKQVADMEAEGDKLLAAETGTTDIQPKAEPQNAEPKQVEEPPKAVVEEPKAEPQKAEPTEPQPTGMLNNLGAHGSEQSAKEKAISGRLTALSAQFRSEKNKWADERSELVKKLEELESELEAAKKGAQPKANPEDEIAELRKEFGDGYTDDELRNFARAVDTRVERGIRDIRDRFAEQDRRAALEAEAARQNKADQFVEKLNSDFPGFSKLDAEGDPRWVAFLKTSLGGVMEGTTYGEIAKAALQKLDYRQFSEVVRAFAKENNLVFSADSNKRDKGVDAQVRPDSVNAGSRTHKNTEKPIIARSEIKMFRRHAFANKAERIYNMTSDEVRRQLDFYEDAEAENRVDETR